jgi:hypothetical protein
VVCLFLSNSARMANRDSRSARSSPANNCLRARKRRRYPESARRAVEDDMMKEVVMMLCSVELVFGSAGGSWGG